MSMHEATETPKLPGWYLCRAVDDRWNDEFRFRAWCSDTWWIPLPDGWLQSCAGIYKWAGPFADVNGPAPDGTNPGGPVPAATAEASDSKAMDRGPANSEILIRTQEVLYRLQAVDTKDTEDEAMGAVYDYFLSGRPAPDETEDFIVQYMQRRFRFQTSFTVLLSVANLDEKIPSYDKLIEYCYTQAAAEEIPREDAADLIEEFRNRDFTKNAARPAWLRIESYMAKPPAPPPRPAGRVELQQFVPPFT